MTDYPYATGDLIEAPNTYFYSQYGGRAFVAAWRNDRMKIRAALPEPLAPQPAQPLPPAKAASRNSVDLLELALSGDTTLAEAFAKKFEIHKRVHDGYDEKFRALDKTARRSLPLYLRAADLFAALYEDSGTLRHLNVYLKCLDTLCSLSNDLDANLAARLAWHLEQEAAFIGDLMTTRNIAS